MVMHLIEDDLSGEPLVRWSAEAISGLERLLANHAAFEQYLAARDSRTT